MTSFCSTQQCSLNRSTSSNNKNRICLFQKLASTNLIPFNFPCRKNKYICANVGKVVRKQKMMNNKRTQVSTRPANPCLPQPSFFVVYNMVSTEVLAVFENTSDQLLELFENFCDLFRNATLHSQAVQFPCSASSNNYARQVQRRYGEDTHKKRAVIEPKYHLLTLEMELFFFFFSLLGKLRSRGPSHNEM